MSMSKCFLVVKISEPYVPVSARECRKMTTSAGSPGLLDSATIVPPSEVLFGALRNMPSHGSQLGSCSRGTWAPEESWEGSITSDFQMNEIC